MSTDPSLTTRTAEPLQVFLAGRDVPCPQCDYNLRDLFASRCPECGEELFLRVNVATPKLKALIAGVIALSASAGLNGLILIFGITLRLTRPGFNPHDHFFLTAGSGSVVFISALVVWLMQWNRLQRVQMRSRAGLAVLCWILVAIDLVLFCKYIR